MNESKPNHPTFEELLALTVDELPAERADEVREHLLGCPECLAQARELLSFSDEPPTPQQAIGVAEEERAWQRLKTEIEGPPAVAPLRFERPLPSRAPRTKLWSLPVAAVLSAAVGLLGGLVLRSPGGGESDESLELSAGAPTFFGSAAATLGSSPQPKLTTAICPRPGGTFVWVLPFVRPPAEAREAELTMHRDGAVFFGPIELAINERSQVVLVRPSKRIPNGEYSIELEAKGAAGEVKELLRVSVACP